MLRRLAPRNCCGKFTETSAPYPFPGVSRRTLRPEYALLSPRGHHSIRRRIAAESAMSLGTILIILLVIILLGGFSGRIGGYGYGLGHSGMGLFGVILIVLLILVLLGKL